MSVGSHPLSGAIQQYFSRLYAQPDDVDAYKTLEAILVQTGDWRRLAEANELVADGIFDSRERLQAYLRASGLYESKLNDDVNATRVFAKAVGVSPADTDALGGYLRVLVKQQQWATALAALQSAIDVVPEPRRRAEFLVDSARLRAARLDDVAGALADFRRALIEDPTVPRFREAAETTLGSKNAWEELALLWRAFAESSKDPIARAGAMVDAAHVYRDRLGRPGDAAAMLESSADGQPPGARMFVEAIGLYEQAGRWTDVLRLLEREKAVTTDRVRVRQILQKVAEIQAGPLGDPAAAADTWQALLKIFPDDLAAQQAVHGEMQRAGRWEDLAAMQMRTLEREKDAPKWREVALTTAKLYEERLASPERAMRLYEEISRRDPADVEVIEALTRVYEARGRWADLAATCERAAGLLGEVAGRPYLHHAASLHEFRLGRPDRATSLYRTLLDQDSSDEFAASALVRLHREAGEHGPLSRALSEFAKIAADPAGRRDALAERGSLLANQLADPIGAVAAFQEALKDEAAWVPGVQGLQDALRKAIEGGGRKVGGKFGADPVDLQFKLIEALDTELGTTDDTKRRNAIFREQGELYEARSLPEEARAQYEKARVEDGTDLLSLEPLGRLYHQAQMESAEAGVLRELARLRRESGGRAQAWFTLGAILQSAAEEGRIGSVGTDEENAAGEPWVACWKRAVQEDPRHRFALKALGEHAELGEDWDRAVELLSTQATIATDAQERANLLTRAGDHLRTKLDDEVGAMAKYSAAVALAPRHVPAARPLADALFRSRRWAEAEPLYRRLGAELALESTPKGAAEAYWRAGTAYRELGRDDDAITQWRRAVDTDATFTPALDDLAALLRKRAEWRAAREVYAKILNLASSGMDTAKQAATQRALAVIAEALNEPDEAIDRYKKVAHIDSGDIDALTCLARLYVDSRRWRDALDVYEQLLPYTGNPGQAADLYLKRGEILAERLDEPARAVDAYAAALAARPSIETRFRLADALARSGRWREAAAERSRLAEEEVDSAVRIDHLLVVAEISRDKLRDEAATREAFEKVLALDAVDRRALVPLAALYEKAQMWEPLVRVLRTSANTVPANRKAALCDLRTRIASILSDKLSNTTEAVGELRLALAAESNSMEALNRMALLAPTDPAFDREALNAHHRLLDKDPLRIESMRVLGEIYARGGRGERARVLAELLSFLKVPHKPLDFAATAARKTLPAFPEFPLAPEDLANRIPHPGELNAILKIMRLLEPSSDKLYPPDLESKGAGLPTDLIEKADKGTLPFFAHKFAKALGVESLMYYRARASSVDAMLESGKIPCLLLGPRLLAENPKEAAHSVARVLWYLADGVPLLGKLKGEVYDRLVLATIASVLENEDGKRLAAKARADESDLAHVRSKLGRKQLKEMKSLALQAVEILGEDPRAVVKQWRRYVQMSGERAALLLTGDVSGAIRRALGGGTPAEIAAREPSRVAEIVRASPETLELMRFACAEEFFVLREALGFTGQT